MGLPILSSAVVQPRRALRGCLRTRFELLRFGHRDEPTLSALLDDGLTNSLLGPARRSIKTIRSAEVRVDGDTLRRPRGSDRHSRSYRPSEAVAPPAITSLKVLAEDLINDVVDV